jgi:Flp pilus assembly protein TadG
MANMKNKRRERRGITLIEMAAALFTLLIITMGVIEYGWMFFKSHQIANAARQGARIGARPSSEEADAIAAVNQALTNAGIPLSVVIGITFDIPPESADAGETFTLTLEVDYDALGLHMPLVPTPATLHSAVTMAREGP